MSLKAKHWEECKCEVNGIVEPFILLSYTLTYKQRIKHVHVLGINVFSCTVDMSDEACGLKLGLSRLLGTQAPSQRKSSLSPVTHVDGNRLFTIHINYSSAPFP